MLALLGSLKAKFSGEFAANQFCWHILKFLVPSLEGLKDRSKVLYKSFSVPHGSFDPTFFIL